MKKINFIVIAFAITSCAQKEQVDLIVTNATVYTVNSNFEKAEAFAIKDGKFLAVGTTNEIIAKYESEKIIDAKQQTIIPGFIDAHCHFLGLGHNQQNVDLVGTKSFEEVIERVLDFQKKNNSKYILGRGWDQNDWEQKEFPDNLALTKLFPTIPIALSRIDGHAILCNQAALDLGKVTAESKIEGGELLKNNGKLTGVLVDNAESLVMNYWPKDSKNVNANALLAAQKICFEHGLTTVDDAGLNRSDIELIDSLQKAGVLKIRIYAMVSASKDNLDYYLQKGIVKTDRLNVCSFKFYADGALGSRGAILRAPYSDKHNHYGLMVNSIDALEETAQRISHSKFQMNTHAIGDSANHAVLIAYSNVLKNKPDRRWRIEHAQVVSKEDFVLFKDIVPSVQPTHATSDMYWAEDRLGKSRIKEAYAYKELLNQHGKIALGTDFPVELVNPFLTFYAAVSRQDQKQFPEKGFQIENALSREETLKGMTIWAAYSNFEENEKGSIEAGKFADFIILDKNIMQIPIIDIPKMKVMQTYLGGSVQ